MNSSPWLPKDRRATLDIGRLRLRADLYPKRLVLTPFLDLNWEEGWFSLGFGFLSFFLAAEWDFDVDWIYSEEADEAMQYEYNQGSGFVEHITAKRQEGQS